MRRAVTLFLVLTLAACGQTAPPAAPEPEAPALEAAAPPAPAGEPMSTGLMGGMSDTAMSITGSLTVEPTALSFENFAAQTEYLGVVDAATPITQGGDSFAAAASRSGNLRVELRRITGEAPAQLCGGVVATHAALISDDPLTGLTLVAFSGADTPGPSAHDSAVCATYLYGVD